MKPIGKIKDPHYEEQWGLHLMHVPEAWPYAMGDDVVVGLIDSGVDGSHEDLGWGIHLNISGLDSDAVVRKKYRPVMDAIESGKHPKIMPGYNFIEKSVWTWDRNRHGTYLAGAMAAESDGFGMVGVASECKIRPYIVLDNGRWAGERVIEQAILKATADGCDVINMSLAWYKDYPIIKEAIEVATEEGCIVVAATGNKNREGIAYPALYQDTIAIGGCDPKGLRWEHNSWRGSSGGDGIDCVCPGAAQITTRKMRSRFTRIDGTSMACANFTGVVALLKSIDDDYKSTLWFAESELELIHRAEC